MASIQEVDLQERFVTVDDYGKVTNSMTIESNVDRAVVLTNSSNDAISQGIFLMRTLAVTMGGSPDVTSPRLSARIRRTAVWIPSGPNPVTPASAFLASSKGTKCRDGSSWRCCAYLYTQLSMNPSHRDVSPLVSHDERGSLALDTSHRLCCSATLGPTFFQH
jgi:hypothetical protein